MCRSQEGYIRNTRSITTLLGGKLKILEEIGYQRNEYNWCVMNKIIDNKQCTILWHVGDLNKSQVDPVVISSVIADIDVEYGKIAKMTIMRGKFNKCIIMIIEYSSPVTVIFYMINYIRKILDIIPEYMKGNQPHLLHTTSSTFHKIQPNCPSLTQILSPFCSITAISFKEGAPIHSSISILHVQYSYRAWHWRLKESDRVD